MHMFGLNKMGLGSQHWLLLELIEQLHLCDGLQMVGRIDGIFFIILSED